MSTAARAAKASSAAGLKLQSAAGSGDLEALVPEAASAAEMAEAVARLEHDTDVAAVSIEYRRKLHALTNDPLLVQQWYLLSAEPAATRADAAWDVTQGNARVIVAVVDTGVRFEHPDLQGKVLPGYDFISNALVANDGNGRDGDASDPGDWVTLDDVNQDSDDSLNEECLSGSGGTVNSSWHGTRVAGLIAAGTNNAMGIAGNAWQASVLPVRAMGKCGGYDFDIVAGMRWAAGLPVSGVPTNAHPAQIINLSLGGDGPCTAVYQDAVNEILARGTLIVASAGNEGQAVNAPANCTGVLGVGGLRHVGTKVGYSNLGPEVGLSAPAGNCFNSTAGSPCLFSIVVTTNTGTTVPLSNTYTDSFNFNVGTSFSAPLVASAAALLRSVNDALTPAQSILLLKDAARPFPASTAPICTIPVPAGAPQDTECQCTAQTCGAGMLDTGAALLAAQSPLAVIETSGTIGAGSTVSISGTHSFASQGRSIAAHQWSIANVTGATPTLANSSAATTTLRIPGESQFTLRLTVTDDQGTQDTKDLALTTSSTPSLAPTPTPSPPAAPGAHGGGGGGGGGQAGWELLTLALAALVRRVRDSRRPTQ